MTVNSSSIQIYIYLKIMTMIRGIESTKTENLIFNEFEYFVLNNLQMLEQHVCMLLSYILK